MRNRRALNSPRLQELRKSRRKVLRNKIIIILVSLLVLFVLLGVFSRWHKMKILDFQISGQKVLEAGELAEFIEGELSGNYAFLYSKRNWFIYPRKQLEANLLDKFKRIESLELNVNNDRILELVIKERGASYTWCDHEFYNDASQSVVSSVDSYENCYFLDSNGYIFDEAPYFSGNVYFRFFGGIDASEKIVGQSIAPGYFTKLALFKDLVKGMGLEPIMFVLDQPNKTELYLAYGDNPKIIFEIDSEVKELAENLQSAITTEPFKSELEENYGNLSYIDLRFGNKVYYKFK